jgi:precorrin-3B synthase
MTARAIDQRRGACPRLSAPMPTGDGLLVRLIPIGTVALDALARLCAAARTHGNGVIEITSRGSIQIRGLSAASAPRLAADTAALGIAAAEDGIPVLTNPLAGIDAEEIFDTGALAVKLRRALADAALATRLAPKVSVAIDGGGMLDLAEGLAADVRLRAEAHNGATSLRVSVGGHGASAVQLGAVMPAQGVAAAMRVLEVLARHGRDARARDILAAEGLAPFHSALRELIAPAVRESDEAEQNSRWLGNERRVDAIGMHRLRDGSLAAGIGLAFGHTDATALKKLIDAAADAGASGMRTAPGRTLLTIGLTDETAPSFIAAAARLGLIVRADDPRRRVIACAGAPVCASAHIAARALAPRIAESAAPFASDRLVIHISGCAKGCAHPGPAVLTVVGTAAGCALITNGSPGDRADTLVQTRELPDAIASSARALAAEPGHV